MANSNKNNSNKNKEKNTKGKNNSTKKPILGFDEVANTEKEKEKYTPNLIEMNGTVHIDIDDEIDELSNHFFPTKKEEDDADKFIIDVLTKDENKKDEEMTSEELTEAAKTFLLYHLDEAFPNFSQEYFDRRLKGEEITKDTIKKIIVNRTIESIKANPEQRKILEESGGEKEWKSWFKSMFDLPGFQEKYNNMLENLITYSDEELANHIELNKKRKENKEEEEEYFVTDLIKKNEGEKAEQETINTNEVVESKESSSTKEPKPKNIIAERCNVVNMPALVERPKNVKEKPNRYLINIWGRKEA